MCVFYNKVKKSPDLFKIVNWEVLGRWSLARCLRSGAFDSTDCHLGSTFALRPSHGDKLHALVVAEPSKRHSLSHAMRQACLSAYSRLITAIKSNHPHKPSPTGYCLTFLHPTQHKKKIISETFPTPSSWLGMEKQNLTQKKHTFTNQKKCTTTQNKHKKITPGLVASYDIRPGNGEGLFLFQCFINLSLTY